MTLVEKFGKLKEHKTNGGLRENVFEKEFLRYRIELDVTKPILTGFFLERNGRKPTWIDLKYENLPNVCFKCGVLTHDTRSCKRLSDNLENEYGMWLKTKERAEFIPQWPEIGSGEELTSRTT